MEDMEREPKVAEIAYMFGRNNIKCKGDLYDVWNNVFLKIYNRWNTLPTELKGKENYSNAGYFGYISEFTELVIQNYLPDKDINKTLDKVVEIIKNINSK